MIQSTEAPDLTDLTDVDRAVIAIDFHTYGAAEATVHGIVAGQIDRAVTATLNGPAR